MRRWYNYRYLYARRFDDGDLPTLCEGYLVKKLCPHCRGSGSVWEYKSRTRAPSRIKYAGFKEPCLQGEYITKTGYVLMETEPVFTTKSIMLPDEMIQDRAIKKLLQGV